MNEIFCLSDTHYKKFPAYELVQKEKLDGNYKQIKGLRDYICVSHSLTHSDVLDSVDRRRSGTMARQGHRGLDTTNTKELLQQP